LVLPHLDAAYNLARWLLGNDQDAEDVVQDSAIRAFDALKTFRGNDGKAWLLAIVRNSSYNCLRRRKSSRVVDFEMEDLPADPRSVDPETLVLLTLTSDAVKAAMDELPIGYREIVVLRELEGMSYKEIAETTGIPIGTVMSRLSRARQRLQDMLQGSYGEETK